MSLLSPIELAAIRERVARDKTQAIAGWTTQATADRKRLIEHLDALEEERRTRRQEALFDVSKGKPPSGFDPR